jgi:two-component system OmpR family sensor kinase
MRSIKNRLALLFFAIVLAAIGIIYVYVVPQLESRLREEKLDTLAAAAQTYSDALVAAIGSNLNEEEVNRAVRLAADRSNARVTLLGVSSGTEGLQLFPISDSTAETELGESFDVALTAARTGEPVVGWEDTERGRLGEAARPLFFNDRVARVVVFSQPLTDVQANVALIQRQILIAGAIALLVAVVAGYLVARAMSQRIKRLEGAAKKVAGGDFSQPIPVDSADELGQLAVAFNDMQRQLAQLDSARKRFIATASHELRTPIFSIGGFLELIDDEELDPETRERFVGQARAQTDRLRRLATELLDLSRLEAGSLELRPESVDVRDIARQLAAEFTPALNQHSSELTLELDDEPVEAELDRERVAQILRILLNNAVSHTPRGTDIAVIARRDNGVVRLAVRDAGMGIEPDELEQVFEPFWTSDAQGSGLGLAIARELAERMHGKLAVTSEPGRTVFTLEIPAPRGRGPARPAGDTRVPARQT